MINNLYIKNNILNYITQEAGDNALNVIFQDGEGDHENIEVYKGDEYYGLVQCEAADDTLTVSIPQEIFTGSRIHFRQLTGFNKTHGELEAYMNEELEASQNVGGLMVGIPGPFYHICVYPNNPYVFNLKNAVVISN